MTRGLMGNWTFDIEDDFYLPTGDKGPIFDTTNIRGIHENFGMKCERKLISYNILRVASMQEAKSRFELPIVIYVNPFSRDCA